ncbi:biopolymer transporter ExbB [Pseudogemmobacter bohemicus]|uniref:biopolymer transporter ExbB n=1 Tax=Pseudogemmobacter bohemicus TaxID=2250708 RepID=UPI000DD47F8F|nr:biopolymer transporter ExbB [Pseudogemmobacter bohemicus]
MQRPEAAPGSGPREAVGTTFSQPIRAIVTMLIVCALVAVGVWFMHQHLEDILLTNPWLNGLIAFVFGLGVVTCFWQVWILAQSVSWIENYVRETPGVDEAQAPLLLAPLASLLKSRSGRSLAISSSSGRSILDSVAQRVDEARDITRYLINLLVFLGLLGTFWGLATTVPSVVDTIRSLRPAEGESGLAIFGKLMQGLEGQLGGMGTAFSSSLLGLGGSLVLGLLELFAGHGQNRFYRELEEWLSSITRIGLAEGEGGGDQSAVVMVLDQLASQMEVMQAHYIQADQARAGLQQRLDGLAQAVGQLAAAQGRRDPDDETLTVLRRMAEGQERLLAALSKAGPSGEDPESRMRLRSIDVQMLRVLEEVSAGRQETLADLRHDLAQLTLAVRQLARQPMPPGRG